MDSVGHQKTRRFTKIAWCEKRRKNPRKKVVSRSQKAGQAGAAGKVSPDVRQTKEVTPTFGLLLFGASLIFSALMLLWS
jgi:hypothetical protein